MGISCFLGPQTVIEAGDASLSLMFVKLFGEQAGALPNVIAFIAVLGGANGMVLATLRMPQSLALHHMMPLEHTVSRMSPTLRFPVVSPALTRARRAAAPAIALASSLAIGLSSISDPTRWPFVVAFTALLLVMTFALTPKRDA